MTDTTTEPATPVNTIPSTIEPTPAILADDGTVVSEGDTIPTVSEPNPGDLIKDNLGNPIAIEEPTEPVETVASDPFIIPTPTTVTTPAPVIETPPAIVDNLDPTKGPIIINGRLYAIENN